MTYKTLTVVVTLTWTVSQVYAAPSVYCDSKDSEIQYSVSVDNVVGTGKHRRGFLAIEQLSEDRSLASRLADDAAVFAASAPCQTRIVSGTANLIVGEPIARLHFDFDKYAITPMAKRAIDTLSTQQVLSDKTLSIEGHTDSVGSQGYNQELGLKRALSVYDLLTEIGVDKNNITVRTYGETQPLVPNDSSQNRSLNRRSEVYISSQHESD
ncbi:OmpA family protein [Vibrio wakamikoensis]|uniref:OmpA family protein n=1 Tax=Vibrio wakamikoensis TaxID=2910251 RepID=UPI003D2032B6